MDFKNMINFIAILRHLSIADVHIPKKNAEKYWKETLIHILEKVEGLDFTLLTLNGDTSDAYTEAESESRRVLLRFVMALREICYSKGASFRNLASYMMSTTRDSFDYNKLASLMSENAALRITRAPNMTPAPSIEYTFYSSFTVVETIRPPFSFVTSMYNTDFLNDTIEIINEWLNEKESF